MSWTGLTRTDPFGVHNLPWCAFTTQGTDGLGVRVGDRILDASAAERLGLLDAAGTLAGPTLNPFLALGRTAWTAVRHQLTTLLTDESYRSTVADILLDLDAVALRLPVDVGDYVDFYSSEHHAANVGRILRPGQPPVGDNWRQLPIGYHGRAGTIVVSGTPIRRPTGQLPTVDGPVFGPTARLDIEAELGFILGTPSVLGAPVPISEFREHVFGAVVLNDWSARDIQAWEYRPLGPFLGKSFATSISPWLVPLDALELARCPAPPQDPAVLPYLREDVRQTYQIELEVRLNETVISRPPYRSLYWTPAQQLAHLTSNGASLRTGDVFASGTISGPARDQWGSLLELTHGGAEPIRLVDGTTRGFLTDGDRVRIAATAHGSDGTVVGFGEVDGTVDAS